MIRYDIDLSFSDNISVFVFGRAKVQQPAHLFLNIISPSFLFSFWVNIWDIDFEINRAILFLSSIDKKS